MTSAGPPSTRPLPPPTSLRKRRRTLEAHNYRCYTTEALALYFERREINIVISDLHMGMMDGVTLVRSLRKLNPAIKVIVSSGHVQNDNHAALQSRSVKAILEKPYTADKLLKSLKDLIAAH